VSLELIDARRIKPNHLNARLDFDESQLEELVKSIRHTGVLQPIVVRPAGEGYEVVIGERRFRAAKKAGLEKIPAIVRNYDDERVAELGLTENIQREDLTAVEKGRSVRNLLEKFPHEFPSVRAVANMLGYSEAVIRAWLELAQAPGELQKLVEPTGKSGVPRRRGTIDSDTALSITRKIKAPERQVAVARALANARIYRRAARKVVKEASLHPSKSVDNIVAEVLQEAPSIPFLPEHAALILDRVKTQTSRKGTDPRIRVGSKVEAYTKFAELSVNNLTRKKLGDFTSEDANREGGYSLNEFKEVWKKLHGNWNPDETVTVISFDLEKNSDMNLRRARKK
jgi:ParB family transcriptional regulator, chromosome partitioning protein